MLIKISLIDFFVPHDRRLHEFAYIRGTNGNLALRASNGSSSYQRAPLLEFPVLQRAAFQLSVFLPFDRDRDVDTAAFSAR